MSRVPHGARKKSQESELPQSYYFAATRFAIHMTRPATHRPPPRPAAAGDGPGSARLDGAAANATAVEALWPVAAHGFRRRQTLWVAVNLGSIVALLVLDFLMPTPRPAAHGMLV